MKILNLAWVGAALALLGCGSPVPSGVYLTLSVSTSGVTVDTSVNGKHNEFMSSDNGWMSGGGPLNSLVHEGENEVTFVLNAAEAGDSETADLGFNANLEVVLKDEVVDSRDPGERVIFTRALGDDEKASLAVGETVTISQSFTVDKAALEAIKSRVP